MTGQTEETWDERCFSELLERLGGLGSNKIWRIAIFCEWILRTPASELQRFFLS